MREHAGCWGVSVRKFPLLLVCRLCAVMLGSFCTAAFVGEEDGENTELYKGIPTVFGAIVGVEVRSCPDHREVWYACQKGVDTRTFG